MMIKSKNVLSFVVAILVSSFGYAAEEMLPAYLATDADVSGNAANLSAQDFNFLKEFQKNYASLGRMAQAYTQLDMQLDQVELKWVESDYRLTLKRAPTRLQNESFDQYINRLNNEVDEHLENTRGDFERTERYQRMSSAVHQDIMTYLNRPGNETTRELYLEARDESPRIRIRVVGRELQRRYYDEAKKIFPETPELSQQIKEIERAKNAEINRIEQAIEQAHRDYEAAKAALFENRNAAVRANRGIEAKEDYDEIMTRAESMAGDLKKKYQETYDMLEGKLKTAGYDVRKQAAKTNLRAALLSQIFVYNTSTPEEHFKLANQRVSQIVKSAMNIKERPVCSKLL
jgi:hypothetical protein